MEDQIGTVLHWSDHKEPKQAKSKDEVMRRNLDRIRISAATPLPSNPSRHNQVSLIQKKLKQVVPGTTNLAHLRHKVILGIKFKFDTSLT